MENIRKNGNQISVMTITEYLGGRRILCQHFKTLCVVKNNLQGLQIAENYEVGFKQSIENNAKFYNNLSKYLCILTATNLGWSWKPQHLANAFTRPPN